MVKGHDSQGVQGIAGVAFHISIKLTELRALIVPQKPLVSLSLQGFWPSKGIQSRDTFI